MTAFQRLDFYSYDSISNPWLGGGGAYRDLEILSRMKSHFGVVRLYVGGYPGARRTIVRGVEIVPLGLGRNEIASRLTYVLSANLHLLFRRHAALGVCVSLYSPFWAALLHRKRTFGVAHHIIGDKWLEKSIYFGKLLRTLESWCVRMLRYHLVYNDDVDHLVRMLAPRAEVLLSSNSYDPNLLGLCDTSLTQKPYILFIGRLDPFMKGLDYLVSAFATLAPEFPNLGLVLAGKADADSARTMAELIRKQGVEGRVRVRPNVSNAEKADLLSGCLVFSSPSRFEGFCIAALEASAVGKPVVVSHASGFKSSVREGFSGLCVDPERPGALAAALRSLIADPDARRRMGKQGIEWAKNFSWETIAEREAVWLVARLGKSRD